MRRGLFDLYEANSSPTAKEALERISKLYEIEATLRGQSASVRLAARQQHSVAVLDELHRWMIDTRTKLENRSELAKALDYELNPYAAVIPLHERWHAGSRQQYRRTLRARCRHGRKNFMFFGSDSGGERAAIAYSLIETCKLNHIDPQRYLEYVLARMPITRSTGSRRCCRGNALADAGNRQRRMR